jgi:hypothetical protein
MPPRSVLLLVMLMLNGCAPAPVQVLEEVDAQRDTASASVDVASPDINPQDTVSADRFTMLGEFPIEAGGVTAAIPLTRALDSDLLALRVVPRRDPTHCLQISALVDDEGVVLIPEQAPGEFGPFCASCAQRAYVGRGYGLYVFPNNGHDLETSSTLSVRVHLRDCMTLLPAFAFDTDESVVVEVLEQAVDVDVPGTLELQVAILEGSRLFGVARVEDDALFNDAMAFVGATLAEAGITLAVRAGVQVPYPSEGPLAFGGGDDEALDLAHRLVRSAPGIPTAQAESALLILTPCMTRKDALGNTTYLEGYVPRIPGGFAPLDVADAVFVKDAHCGGDPGTPYWWSGEQLGRVIVHELGHYLGLYHLEESTGEPDHLTDTEPPNMMVESPLSDGVSGWSPQQVHVMRHHPFVRSAQ